MGVVRGPRDIALLDAIDGLPREPVREAVWRVVPGDRDPLLAAASVSRWCDGAFDVLYTSLERNGALSEIHALLQNQPVFPSKVDWFVHRLSIRCSRVLRLDNELLAKLGIDATVFRGRDYQRSQQIADVAHFLDFDGLLVPSARWPCSNLVVFLDKVSPDELSIDGRDDGPIDWQLVRASLSK